MVCCVGCCPSLPKRRVCEGQPNAAIPQKETAECRLCYEHGETKNLIAPCKCNGHMKYVHRDCLDVWRAHNQHCEHFFRCDICGLPYVLEQHRPEAPEEPGMSPMTKYRCLVYGDIAYAVLAFQAIILVTAFLLHARRSNSDNWSAAGHTFFQGFGCGDSGSFWTNYRDGLFALLALFGSFTLVMQCVNCFCPTCFTGTCWRGEIMSDFWWSCGCCDTADHQPVSKQDNYAEGSHNHNRARSSHHGRSSGGCCDGPCICFHSSNDCNCQGGGGGGSGKDDCMGVIAIIIVILIIIGCIQLMIFSVIVVQLIIRRHIHVLEKRYLAAIWRVRDRDGEDLSNQVVHVQWYNIVQTGQDSSAQPGATAIPSAQPAGCSFDKACGSKLPPVAEHRECHLTMGPEPPQGYPTLVRQVKGLGW